jgi:hypothetical protein
MKRRSAIGGKRFLLGVWLSAAVLGMLPGAAAAQKLPGAQPWRPTAADSTRIWATEAKAVLEASTNQDLGDEDLRAFMLLNQLTLNYFQKLGPRGMGGAAGLHTALDTLGLRIEITQDPDLPAFTLVNYLNPISDKFASLAFLYWFRGDELRSQPLNLGNGRWPQLRVFWIGAPEAPYEAALIHHEGDGERRSPVISTLRLSPNADVWFPRQMSSQAVRLDGTGDAVWADVNNNGLPEVVSWTESHPGPPFEFCDAANCPHVIVQSVFGRLPNGRFTQIERREMSLPIRSLVRFVQALRHGEAAAARQWADNDQVIRAAGDYGWARIEGENTFKILRDRGEAGEDQRIRVAYQLPGDEFTAAEVYFVNREGEWLIGGIALLAASLPGEGGQGGKGSPE